jgi:hypothetical protein
MSRIGVLVAAVALALAAGGCSGGSEPSAAPTTASPTPLAEFATDDVTVARADFCARVAPTAVEDAIGGKPDSADAWANGERARLADGVTDVAHEYGCRWSAADGTTAQGWVFAPPVTPGEAESFRRAAAGADGCQEVRDAPRFGARTVAVRCQDGTTSFHGLFGDAWLSCSLTLGDGSSGQVPGEVLDRAGRWCVTVAQAASA